MAEFKDIMRQLRKERGWTQEDVANKIGRTKVSVSQYETGLRKPSFEIIEALADVYQIDLNYLLGFTDRIEKPAGDESVPDDANKYLAVNIVELDIVNAWRHADDQTKRIVAYALGLKEIMDK